MNKSLAPSTDDNDIIVSFADARMASLSAVNPTVLEMAPPSTELGHFGRVNHYLVPEKMGPPFFQIQEQTAIENQNAEANASTALQPAENNATTWLPAGPPPAPSDIVTPNFALMKQRRVAQQHAAGWCGAAVGFILLGPVGGAVCAFVCNKITRGITKSAEYRIRREYMEKVDAAKTAASAKHPAHEAEVA